MMNRASLALPALTALGGLLLAGCAPMLASGTSPTGSGTPAARLNVAQPAPNASTGTLKLSSPQFTDGGTLTLEQAGTGCGGQGVSPELDWTGVPAGTVSLVLTTYDPDAPTGSGYRHWTVYNIPASAASLTRGAGSMGGSLPSGAGQTANDGGTPGYTGPCPPVGDRPHRYIFTLYALGKTLDVPQGANQAAVGFMVNANAGAVLAKTAITGYYSR